MGLEREYLGPGIGRRQVVFYRSPKAGDIIDGFAYAQAFAVGGWKPGCGIFVSAQRRRVGP